MKKLRNTVKITLFYTIYMVCLYFLSGSSVNVLAEDKKQDAELLTMTHQEARWDPIHFKPAIDSASNDQCLECHQDVLENTVLEASPAGVKANETLAWYQTLDTYEGEQQTFHQRHLTSKMATELMDLKCSTCHQGHDPSAEISHLVQSGEVDQTIRKLVKPEICVMCLGGLDATTMAGLAGTWPEVRDKFNNDCMVCHTIFRTVRHQVNYLKPEAIEKAAENKGDSCYGCHGGRAWYSTDYAYPRNAWTGMALAVPDWAKDRPTVSDARFLVGVGKPKEVVRPEKKVKKRTEEDEDDEEKDDEKSSEDDDDEEKNDEKDTENDKELKRIENQVKEKLKPIKDHDVSEELKEKK